VTYEIDHNIDGWPITKDGEPMSKKEVLAELNRLQSTIDGLTEVGCVPPSWLEAEQLREGVEGFLARFDETLTGAEIVDALNGVLDGVTAADSLPVATQLHDLRDEVKRLRAVGAA